MTLGAEDGAGDSSRTDLFEGNRLRTASCALLAFASSSLLVAFTLAAAYLWRGVGSALPPADIARRMVHLDAPCESEVSEALGQLPLRQAVRGTDDYQGLPEFLTADSPAAVELSGNHVLCVWQSQERVRIKAVHIRAEGRSAMCTEDCLRDVPSAWPGSQRKSSIPVVSHSFWVTYQF